MIHGNKKALIFDLDGTLADTLGAITEAINLTMEHFSYPKKTEPEVQRAIGNGARALVKRLMPEKDAEDGDRVDGVLAYYDRMYAETYTHTTEMYDGIREMLNEVLGAGLRIAVYSNKQDNYVKALVRQYLPNGEVSVARGQTDIPNKPDPTGVRLILAELGVSATDCVFIGDSGVDARTAENSGMDFIGVAWGFCGREALEKLGAENIADKPCEILKMLSL